MKLEFLTFDFDKFASEMANLKDKKGFDYLVTIVGEDFGADEGLGCIYILENTNTHERCSVKMLAKVVDGESVIPSVINIWRVADLLEREVFDFYGILFLGHPDMRRLYLRNDFKGHPFRKDWKGDDKYSLEEDVEPDYGLQYEINQNGKLVVKKNALF
ncbi:MAG: NADH-quinone oxidoreductase subunit C, partial [Prevotella sp.]|nr:NADH-quinone oxidoreductase subunit C [Prevotella sp.]